MSASETPVTLRLPEAGTASTAEALASALRRGAEAARSGWAPGLAEQRAGDLLAAEMDRAASALRARAASLAREEAMAELAAEGRRLDPHAYGLPDGWEEDFG